MKYINVMARYNTSWGLTFIVLLGNFKIGDMVCDQNNDLYEIENIIMPTKPLELDVCSLVVRKK